MLLLMLSRLSSNYSTTLIEARSPQNNLAPSQFWNYFCWRLGTCNINVRGLKPRLHVQVIYDSLLETATSTLRSIAKHQTRIIVLFLFYLKSDLPNSSYD